VPIALALWSLRGLSVVEPDLTAEFREGQLLLVAPSGRVVAVQTVAATPPAAAPAGVPTDPGRAPPSPPRSASAVAAGIAADAVAALFEAAWQASPALRRAGPDAMLTNGFEELFNHLDPYSRYVPPGEAAAARVRRVGQAGLGLRLAAGRGTTVVLAAVTPGGPAALAGLRVGDRLIAIDGHAVSAEDLAAAAARLEGPAETEVVLLVARGARRREVLVVRNPVPPETVTSERGDDILWVRVSAFSNATDQQIAAAFADAFQRERRGKPLRGVVLDRVATEGGC
jgi:carboxyl-terminal processing protease